MGAKLNFCRKMTELVSGPVFFGVVPPEHWYQPDWIDEERAKEGRDRLVEGKIVYGGDYPVQQDFFLSEY